MRRFSRVNRVLFSRTVHRDVSDTMGGSRSTTDKEKRSLRRTNKQVRVSSQRERTKKKKSIPRPGASKPFRFANRKTTAEQNRRQGPLWPDGDGKRSARKKRSLIYGPVARAASPRELRRSVLARTCSYVCTYIHLALPFFFFPSIGALSTYTGSRNYSNTCRHLLRIYYVRCTKHFEISLTLRQNIGIAIRLVKFGTELKIYVCA